MMLLTVQHACDALRGQIGRLKQGRSLEVLAKEIGISKPTLLGFLHGASVTTSTLEKMEAWCHTQQRGAL